MPSPFDPEGWYHLGDADGTTANVIMQNPSGQEFAGLVSQADSYVIQRTLNGVDTVSGQSIYMGILYKAGSINPTDEIDLVFFALGVGETKRTTLSAVDLSIVSGNSDGIKVSQLTDGWSLIESELTTSIDYTNHRAQIVLDSKGLSSSSYWQASFVGVADDFPANVMPTL